MMSSSGAGMPSGRSPVTALATISVLQVMPSDPALALGAADSLIDGVDCRPFVINPLRVFDLAVVNARGEQPAVPWHAGQAVLVSGPPTQAGRCWRSG